MVVAQLLAHEGSRTVESAANSANRDIQNPGDRLVVKPFHVAQDEHESELLRKSTESPLDLGRTLLADQPIGRIVTGVDGVVAGAGPAWHPRTMPGGDGVGGAAPC